MSVASITLIARLPSPSDFKLHSTLIFEVGEEIFLSGFYLFWPKQVEDTVCINL